MSSVQTPLAYLLSIDLQRPIPYTSKIKKTFHKLKPKAIEGLSAEEKLRLSKLGRGVRAFSSKSSLQWGETSVKANKLALALLGLSIRDKRIDDLPPAGAGACQLVANWSRGAAIADYNYGEKALLSILQWAHDRDYLPLKEHLIPSIHRHLADIAGSRIVCPSQLEPIQDYLKAVEKGALPISPGHEEIVGQWGRLNKMSACGKTVAPHAFAPLAQIKEAFHWAAPYVDSIVFKHKLPIEDFRGLIDSLPSSVRHRIRHLEFCLDRSLTPKDLSHLLRKLPNLASLDLRGCTYNGEKIWRVLSKDGRNIGTFAQPHQQGYPQI